MTTTRLHALSGEACALTPLTAPRDEPTADCSAGNRTVHHTPTGLRAIEIDEVRLLRAGFWITGILGLLAVWILFLALLSVNLFPSTTTHAQAIRPVSIASGQASALSKQPAAANIAPAEVIDPNPVFFIGTGDGSAGSWT